MRFWLILLAMLSGLSLADVARATSPVDVVGMAECASVVAAPVISECPVRQRIARARLKLDLARAASPVEAGFATSCGNTVLDRPLE